MALSSSDDVNNLTKYRQERKLHLKLREEEMLEYLVSTVLDILNVRNTLMNMIEAYTRNPTDINKIEVSAVLLTSG